MVFEKFYKYFQRSKSMTRKLKYCIGIVFIFLIFLASIYIYTNRTNSLPFDDQVAFSPSKECENIIIKLIEYSDKIDIAVFDINNDNIVAALKQAENQGKKIRILTDKRQAASKYSKVLDLYKSGINIRVHSKNKIEHNKFAIFDNKYVITGSYNWTNPASNKNSENCLLTVENEEIIADYQSHFDYLWRINTKKKSDAWFIAKLNSQEYNAPRIISKKQQKQIKQALLNTIKLFDAKGGTVIIMNADNGKIVSKVSVNTDEKIMEYAQDFVYSAGSLIKPFIVALALEKNVVDTDSIFDISKPSSFSVQDIKPSNTKLSLNEVLVRSSNIATMQIADKLSDDDLNSFFDKLALSKAIKNTSISTKKAIFSPSFKAGIGNNLQSTPMHLVAAYASLINGGKYHEPYIDKPMQKQETHIISEHNSEIMNKLLQHVVQKGTARQANKLSKAKLSAITGTTVKKSPNHDLVITTFIGNFDDKKTTYVILVMLDEPKPIKETYGFVSAGWNAVPLAANIVNILKDK